MMKSAAPPRPAKTRRRSCPQAIYRFQHRSARATARRHCHRRAAAAGRSHGTDALITASGIPFRIGGDRAFLCNSRRLCSGPRRRRPRFRTRINWHRTALHELGHATGHPSRLNRDQSGSYGTKKYAFEELVAELSPRPGCASLGIVPTVRHADYIYLARKSCVKTIGAIVRPPSQASKAADYLLGFVPGSIEPASLDSAEMPITRRRDAWPRARVRGGGCLRRVGSRERVPTATRRGEPK